MSNQNTVTQEEIDIIMSGADIQCDVIFEKCLVMTVKLPNGFIIVESSACVDPKNFDYKIGHSICLERVVNKVWELEGYVLQTRINSGVPTIK